MKSGCIFILLLLSFGVIRNVPNNINNNDVILYVPKFRIMSRIHSVSVAQRAAHTPRACDIFCRTQTVRHRKCSEF